MVKLLLFLTVLTPFVTIPYFPFPYNFSKIFFFRVIVELALVLFLVHVFSRLRSKGGLGNLRLGLGRFLGFLKSRFALVLGFFFLSAALSTIFAEDVFHAFWSNAERGEGLFSLFHYIVFLGLTVILFDRRDWLRFIKISVVLGILAAALTWFQYAGAEFLEGFPFYIAPDSRPGSVLQNPAFFGSYLIFLIGFAGWLFFRERGTWRYIAGFAIPIFLSALLLGNSRGAILGLGFGTLCFFSFLGWGRGELPPRYRRLARFSLAFLLLLVFVFGFTRTASFWKNIPGLNRLSEISLADSSLKTRFIAFGSSYGAFIERPLVGWGLENYNIAYNRNYNPAYARYEEAWFDRAHNKVMDIAVMQGLFGVAVYFILLVAFLLAVPQAFPSLPERAVFFGLVPAYFLQNLVLFDTPVSYFLLFSLFGFVLSLREKAPAALADNKGKWVFAGVGGVIALGIIWSLYSLHYIPFRQAKTFRTLVNAGEAEKIVAALDKFLTPYNFLQPAIRFQLLQLITNAGAHTDPKFESLAGPAIAAFEEVAEREAEYEPRNLIFLSEVYIDQAKKNPELFKKAEESLRRALVLSPKRQDIYYLLAFALAGEERFDEAVKVAREAVRLDSNVAKAHYNLGLELAFAGREHWDEARAELGKALDIGFVNRNLVESDFHNMATTYQKMLQAYILERDRERTLDVARRLMQVAPLLADDMTALIQLVEKGDWDRVFKTFGEESPK
ncbi:MAG: O-antigen ligase family protein [Parcubacteria group bacterium]|nr:O-antigen ligase family protein [Parcubacteria group bacterium]